MLCYNDIIKYFVISTVLLAIVFVEEIDIFYNPWMIFCLFLVFAVNTVFMCKKDMTVGILIAVLFSLVIVRYQKLKHQRK